MGFSAEKIDRRRQNLPPSCLLARKGMARAPLPCSVVPASCEIIIVIAYSSGAAGKRSVNESDDTEEKIQELTDTPASVQHEPA